MWSDKPAADIRSPLPSSGASGYGHDTTRAAISRQLGALERAAQEYEAHISTSERSGGLSRSSPLQSRMPPPTSTWRPPVVPQRGLVQESFDRAAGERIPSMDATSSGLSLEAKQKPQRLRVGIIGARGLGTADAYCVCEVRGRANSWLQTQVISNSAEPMWRYEGEVFAAAADIIAFDVYDQNPLSQCNFIGRTSVRASEVLGAETGIFEGELLLIEGAPDLQGILMVSLSVHGGVRKQTEASRPLSEVAEKAGATPKIIF
eukprot:TRINITY_DN45334_c0_g1_i4.p1 TRINITY_DN45334_c0_g1~~TRINITY_DN45334_c0_g1_i4.p1  ORF type:complete len:262 (+),score=25.58 TRINITY_DN45334_c0_g1_i4:412-1197(+)